MTAPNVNTGAPVIYGLSSPGGKEAPPELRYEESDKDGIRKITAVLARKIHCLKRYAEAIKQSAAFPGQVVEVDGVVYGANWICRNVNVVPAGEAAIVQIEASREGVTPFEWELPPSISVEMAAGVATLYYSKTDGTKLAVAQWDSQTGEDRYGFRVDYFEAQKLTYANAYGDGSRISIYSMIVYYENREIMRVEGEDALASVSSRFVDGKTEIIGRLANGGTYPTQESAQAAGEAALTAWLDGLKADIAAGAKFSNYGMRFISGLVYVDETAAAVTTVDAAALYGGTQDGSRGWFYKLSVPNKKIVADVDAWKAEFAKGLYWESVTDLNSESATYRHVFYRLRYTGVIVFSYDVTVAEALP